VPPGLSRETLWLRLGGLALIGASLILFAYFDDVLDPGPWLAAPSIASALWPLLCFFVTGNVLALGITLLLSGLRQLSLTTNRQARTGALVRMAAINLMLPCFVFAAVTDAGNLDQVLEARPGMEVVGLLALLPFVYVARTSILLFRSSWKYEAPSAEEVLRHDTRSPVVYLRSFGIDDEIVSTEGGRWAWLSSRLQYTAAASPEQELAWIMARVGPVIAIGKPGERLPQLGAARLYVDDDHWRDTIDDLMARSALIVVRAGDTPNLWWEIERAMTRQRPERVIIVVLGREERWGAFHRRFADTFGTPRVIADKLPSPVIGMMLRWLLPGRTQGTVIYFDRSNTPHQRSLTHPFSLLALLTNVYSPHGAALRGGMEPVFADLGIPWKTSRRSLTVAVPLAFLGGIFGLHHFYLGNRRRGQLCCLFFWTSIPIVLGFIDAVRFVLLDEDTFQALVRVSVSPAASRPL
jgi:TM2 domain-containing membrane protein YozV